MSRHLDRALLLYEQGRYDQASQELRQELAADPNNPIPHSLLALCLVQREDYSEATQEAEAAIHLGPDIPFCHFALGRVLYLRDKLSEAAAAVEEAIRLDPQDPDFFSLLAAIRFDERKWSEALSNAEKGLAEDPEHVECNNMRAMALVKLGRKQEAGETIDAALAKDPENPMTHANYGWALLEQGQREKALGHFREALRLDPENEWARSGIIEALKARNVIYGLMLRYFLWMSKLSQGTQWGIILGGWFGIRILKNLTKDNPSLEPIFWPILILYIGFVFLSWTADSLFNLLLRLDRFGRLALSQEEIAASNWIGGVCLLALVTMLVWLVTGIPQVLIFSLVFAFLIIPLAGTFHCEKGWPRTSMFTYTVVMGLAGIITAIMAVASPSLDDLPPPAVVLGLIFLLGAFFSGWVANILMMKRVEK